MIKNISPLSPKKEIHFSCTGNFTPDGGKTGCPTPKSFPKFGGKLFPGNKRPSTGIHRAEIRYFAPLTFPVFIKKQDGEN